MEILRKTVLAVPPDPKTGPCGRQPDLSAMLMIVGAEDQAQKTLKT